jgi:hypothetical protein
MSPSTLRVVSTCLSHLPEDMWQARLKLFKGSWVHECVERRGCQWFIRKDFVETSSAYLSEQLAFEALRELIDTEIRIRALKEIKALARSSDNPVSTVSEFLYQLPTMTTAPCPPPSSCLPSWKEEEGINPKLLNLWSLYYEVGR